MCCKKLKLRFKYNLYYIRKILQIVYDQTQSDYRTLPSAQKFYSMHDKYHSYFKPNTLWLKKTWQYYITFHELNEAKLIFLSMKYLQNCYSFSKFWPNEQFNQSCLVNLFIQIRQRSIHNQELSIERDRSQVWMSRTIAPYLLWSAQWSTF